MVQHPQADLIWPESLFNPFISLTRNRKPTTVWQKGLILWGIVAILVRYCGEPSPHHATIP